MSNKALMICELVDDSSHVLTFAELAHRCHVDAECLLELIEEGVLEPTGGGPADWRFPPLSIRRVRIALSLQRDLRVNLAGAALAMDLLDELDSLRRRVRFLERELGL